MYHNDCSRFSNEYNAIMANAGRQLSRLEKNAIIKWNPNTCTFKSINTVKQKYVIYFRLSLSGGCGQCFV